ncbi:hypothetical protein [Paenibacillus sp. YPG26]|uniref:hypothetical protein n=1 Tax=Paenibacillus sp. YPG26 TaxID=2878915 RepID=UPI00203FF788|nr:hypothetical protein [Paenibacillus sp. YPG26]USB33396.1 hypothetical protein LDO05_00690 [Paenibacillus sp. YPG26]
MYRKILGWSIALIAVLMLITYFLMNNSGFYITEDRALRGSYPYTEGEVVFKKAYKDKNIIVWKTPSGSFAKVIEPMWGIFYYVSQSAQLSPIRSMTWREGDLERTWSASLNSNEKYETVLAARSDNPEIKRVVVSNDNIDNASEDLEEIKKNSTVFIELKLENGTAASWVELDPQNTGEFVFRGINEKGKIVTLVR